MCRRLGSPCRQAEGHRQHDESPLGECARGRGEWRRGGTPSAQGPWAWLARGDGRRRRGRRIGACSSRGPGLWALREERSRGGGRRWRVRRSGSRSSTGAKSLGWYEAHAVSTWSRVAQAGSMGPRERAVTRHEVRVMVRGEVPWREGYSDRTQGGSQDRGRG
jgi:hypothetical protein